ncbi:hypothetical protein L596_006601 [Steinernema carpocapsae]|uniref:Uncharacterized protein n=1 Tax=Steinernema carpocapsae TaxID=34508 RepID=A0A4U8V2V2_STECR|nr:hypothetical protein L596_006601 [Steinernema carpocapsae]
MMRRKLNLLLLEHDWYYDTFEYPLVLYLHLSREAIGTWAWRLALPRDRLDKRGRLRRIRISLEASPNEFRVMAVQPLRREVRNTPTYMGPVYRFGNTGTETPCYAAGHKVASASFSKEELEHANKVALQGVCRSVSQEDFFATLDKNWGIVVDGLWPAPQPELLRNKPRASGLNLLVPVYSNEVNNDNSEEIVELPQFQPVSVKRTLSYYEQVTMGLVTRYELDVNKFETDNAIPLPPDPSVAQPVPTSIVSQAKYQISEPQRTAHEWKAISCQHLAKSTNELEPDNFEPELVIHNPEAIACEHALLTYEPEEVVCESEQLPIQSAPVLYLTESCTYEPEELTHKLELLAIQSDQPALVTNEFEQVPNKLETFTGGSTRTLTSFTVEALLKVTSTKRHDLSPTDTKMYAESQHSIDEPPTFACKHLHSSQTLIQLQGEPYTQASIMDPHQQNQIESSEETKAASVVLTNEDTSFAASESDSYSSPVDHAKSPLFKIEGKTSLWKKAFKHFRSERTIRMMAQQLRRMSESVAERLITQKCFSVDTNQLEFPQSPFEPCLLDEIPESPATVEQPKDTRPALTNEPINSECAKSNLPSPPPIQSASDGPLNVGITEIATKETNGATQFSAQMMAIFSGEIDDDFSPSETLSVSHSRIISVFQDDIPTKQVMDSTSSVFRSQTVANTPDPPAVDRSKLQACVEDRIAVKRAKPEYKQSSTNCDPKSAVETPVTRTSQQYTTLEEFLKAHNLTIKDISPVVLVRDAALDYPELLGIQNDPKQKDVRSRSSSPSDDPEEEIKIVLPSADNGAEALKETTLDSCDVSLPIKEETASHTPVKLIRRRRLGEEHLSPYRVKLRSSIRKIPNEPVPKRIKTTRFACKNAEPSKASKLTRVLGKRGSTQEQATAVDEPAQKSSRLVQPGKKLVPNKKTVQAPLSSSKDPYDFTDDDETHAPIPLNNKAKKVMKKEPIAARRSSRIATKS